MSGRRWWREAAQAVAVAGLLMGAGAAAPATTAVAVFNGGSGNYLTSDGTDGLRQVSGVLRFTQATDDGPITVAGRLTGLAPRTAYVGVPYKDGVCTPLPGVTAFPSGSFTTDKRGRVTVRNVVVNPQAINPAGDFDVDNTRSVSVRQVVVNAVALPGIPVGTPTVPNAAAVEACDRSPLVN